MVAAEQPSCPFVFGSLGGTYDVNNYSGGDGLLEPALFQLDNRIIAFTNSGYIAAGRPANYFASSV